MSTTLTTLSNIEKSKKALPKVTKDWDPPNISSPGEEKKQSRIRLEIKSAPAVESKKRMARHYLAAEDKSATLEELLALQTKRQHYRNMFEAVSKR